MIAKTEEGWQESSVGDDIPAKGESDVFMTTETIAIIPEVIFGVHVLKVENCVVTTKNNFVPENNLK